MEISAAVSRAISPNDAMFKAQDGDLDAYLEFGRMTVDLLKGYSESPRRVLDFACGWGRVTRHIVAEWPEAEVWACELYPDAVEFCERELGVRGVVSSTNAEDVKLPKDCDLIWVGSLFTHLDSPQWRDFLRLLERALARSGVLVFTTHGRHAAEQIRPWEKSPELFESYDRTGFGYAERPWGWPGYGGSLSTVEWVHEFVETKTGLKVLSAEERGWSNYQDVVSCIPGGPTPRSRPSSSASRGHPATREIPEQHIGRLDMLAIRNKDLLPR